METKFEESVPAGSQLSRLIQLAILEHDNIEVWIPRCAAIVCQNDRAGCSTFHALPGVRIEPESHLFALVPKCVRYRVAPGRFGDTNPAESFVSAKGNSGKMDFWSARC